MKRIAALLTTAFFLCNLSAQEHMTFKGVEIDGTTIQMTKKLHQIGFEYNELFSKKQRYNVFKGKFAEYEAYITYATNVDGIVKSITVSYPKLYSSTKERYNFLKKNLTKKYGKPNLSKKNIIKLEKHINKIYLSYSNDIKSQTGWKTDKGAIILIASDADVTLGYIDKINSALNQQQVYNDL